MAQEFGVTGSLVISVSANHLLGFHLRFRPEVMLILPDGHDSPCPTALLVRDGAIPRLQAAVDGDCIPTLGVTDIFQ